MIARAARRLSENRIELISAQLLDAIKAQSANRRRAVRISAFWSGSGLDRAMRSMLIQRLIDDGLVDANPPAYANDFTQFVGDMWRDFRCVPPKTLTLTDQTWWQMTQAGVSGRLIMKGCVVTLGGTNHGHAVVVDGENVTGVVVGARDAHADVGPGSQHGSITINDAAPWIELANALRADAARAADLMTAQRLATAADLAEQAADDPAEDGPPAWARIQSLIAKYGETMASTIKIVEALSSSVLRF